MSSPTEDHLFAANKVLRYLKSAPAQRLWYPSLQPLTVTAFCDSDWASCPLTRRSVFGNCILLGSALVSWKTKLQTVESTSLAEVEYGSMAFTSRELAWIVRLLADLLISVSSSIPLFCDNQAAIHIAKNPVFHERTKHVELDCHFVRQYLVSGLIAPSFVSTHMLLANLFTKHLPSEALLRFISKLGCSNVLHTSSLRGDLGLSSSSLDPTQSQSSFSFAKEPPDLI